MQTPQSIEEKYTIFHLHLEKIIPKIEGPYATLYDAARYSLLLPGKRLRPKLLFNVLEDYNVPIKKGLDAACSIEMVHTYSLIHDDLPCIDNDDFRRGKPTLHKIFGEAQALLAGNFLLTRAFEVIANSHDLVSILSFYAGGHGLLGGQVVDILNDGKNLDWKTLECAYTGKTASLFSAALQFGSVIANASKEDRLALKSAGILFGIAFQILDDISDEANDENATILTFFSKHEAQKLANTYLDRAINILPETMSCVKKTFFSFIKHD